MPREGYRFEDEAEDLKKRNHQRMINLLLLQISSKADSA